MRTTVEASRSPLVLLLTVLTGLALALAVLVVPSTADAANTVAASQASKPVKKMRVVVKVRNCKKCRVSLVHAPRLPRGNAYPNIWTQERIVKKNKVAFRVPTTRTKGLYLTVWDRKAVSTGAMPVAVARYKGQRVGKKISKAEAAKTKRGFHCATAKKKAKQVWHLRVDRFPGRDFITGRRGYQIRPYLSPAQKQFGPATRLWKGTTATQDVAFCKH